MLWCSLSLIYLFIYFFIYSLACTYFLVNSGVGPVRNFPRLYSTSFKREILPQFSTMGQVFIAMLSPRLEVSVIGNWNVPMIEKKKKKMPENIPFWSAISNDKVNFLCRSSWTNLPFWHRKKKLSQSPRVVYSCIKRSEEDGKVKKKMELSRSENCDLMTRRSGIA